MFTFASTALFFIMGILISVIFLSCILTAGYGIGFVAHGIRIRHWDTFFLGFCMSLGGTVFVLLMLFGAAIADCDENWWPYHNLYDYGDRYCVAQ